MSQVSQRKRECVTKAAAVAAAILLVGAVAGSPLLYAQAQCTATFNDCNAVAAISYSSIQIGGLGSVSSEGLSNPGRLDDGTIAEATYEFTFDRSTGILTLEITNTTLTQATLSGAFFNFSPAVTGLSLVSHNGILDWELHYDTDRTDGVVDTAPWRSGLRGDGFGLFNAFLSNRGDDPEKNAGDPDTEILANHWPLTFVIQVTGDLSQISACSFTSFPSQIPPGDKIVIALGRFQGGVSGGAGYIGPCGPGDLVVSLASFRAIPGQGNVMLAWDTASEIDTAGFAIIRRNPRNQTVERLNSTLIPSQGSPVSGASYAFVDASAVDGVKYHYQLEDWDLSNVNTLHPPELAIPNPRSPRINLVAPAYEDVAGRRVRFEWTSDARRRGMIEISADPLFQADATLRVRTGVRQERTLTSSEMGIVRGMAHAGGEEGVYWRVTGQDGSGARERSQTFFLTVK